MHGFPEQPVLLADIGSEDGHGADPQGQREERLVHRGCNDTAQADFPGPGKIRHKEVLHAFCSPGGQHGIHGEHHHDDQQGAHHPFRDSFQSGLQAPGTDAESRHNHQNGEEHQGTRIRQHIHIVGAYLFLPGIYKLSCDHIRKIPEHPARHDSIEHHEQPVACQETGCIPVPFRARRLQFSQQPGRTGSGSPAGRKFHGHDRQSEHQQKQQVEEQEHPAAVQPGHIGELPDIADADRASRRNQYESQPGSQFFPFH